ncbi:FtsX-like permease family protein [Alkalinema sp. FACHB-956]|uniref:FtsX-like permease family protein n=1 Tax=Alkalinema sp. FACHB-956 TaxID=2692768 RepID=UPI0016882C67|nr:FtsX-like permease family protein [Alkalinema sp. FACHB-956]MBD2327804.1 FtsX-like permease family protein [Alkalinema sp. FACHB-956]
MIFAIPLAWLQLKRETIRLLVAIAGISFAVILMFLQLGFQDALFESAITFHKNLKGDIFIISSQSTALIAMENFPERRLYQTYGVPGIKNVSPMYIGFGTWKNPFWEGLPKSQTRQLMVTGVNPSDDVIEIPGFTVQARNEIRLEDRFLFDSKSREEFGPIAQKFPEYQAKGELIRTEISNKQVKIAGLVELGASFGADGNVITSDDNFRRIFDQRQKGDINVGIIQLEPGTDVLKTLDTLKATMPGALRVNPQLTPEQAREDFIIGDVRILSKKGFINVELKYWQEGTAIGFIFGLGVAIGFIVGIVIVYQILYTDVTDHLAEYATLKAMGYKNRYLLKVVFQEAMILAVMGFIPGYVLSSGMYVLTRNATALPVGMTTSRGIFVFCLAVVMCLISGTIAVRKVQDADPADIF